MCLQTAEIRVYDQDSTVYDAAHVNGDAKGLPG